MPVRVFLLDDHELVRRGVRDLLWSQDDVTVVGEAATAEDALERIPQTRPDVAVLDVRLRDDPGAMNGIEVCREIRSAHPNIACIMLTSFADDEALFASIMAGTAGYVLKQNRGVELVTAIRRVAAGESLLDPFVTAQGRGTTPLPRPRRRSAGRPHPPGATHPRPHRRRQDQPSDRRSDVPGRKDSEELRVASAGQAGDGHRSEAAADAARLAERRKGTTT